MIVTTKQTVYTDYRCYLLQAIDDVVIRKPYENGI